MIAHILRCANQIGGAKLERLPILPTGSRFRLSRRAFKNFLQQYEIFSDDNHRHDVEDFFTDIQEEIINLNINYLVNCKLKIKMGEYCGVALSFEVNYFIGKIKVHSYKVV